MCKTVYLFYTFVELTKHSHYEHHFLKNYHGKCIDGKCVCTIDGYFGNHCEHKRTCDRLIGGTLKFVYFSSKALYNI